MNTKISKFKAKRIFTMVLVITLVLSLTSFSAFATDMTANPEAKLTAKNTVSFSNLDKIAVGEVLEFDVLDSEGNPATVGIKRMPSIMKAGLVLCQEKVQIKHELFTTILLIPGYS